MRVVADRALQASAVAGVEAVLLQAGGRRPMEMMLVESTVELTLELTVDT